MKQVELQQTNFTQQLMDDIMFPTYNTWEEIPMSKIEFNSRTSQICYIKLPQREAVEAIKTQAIPVNTKAYEYPDEIDLKQNEEVLAIEIDTTNMLDLTHKPDYLYYMKHKLDNIKIDDIILIRKAEMNQYTNQIKIVYIIRNNASVKRVYKI